MSDCLWILCSGAGVAYSVDARVVISKMVCLIPGGTVCKSCGVVYCTAVVHLL